MAIADPLDLLGTTIADKYAVEKVVGEGGFAIVYRATHLLWKRPVALKVFRALSDFSEADRQKLFDEFVQEGALLAELSERSASIVQARDIGLLPLKTGVSVPYMVLEWLEGATLEAVFEDEKARGMPLRTVEQAVKLLDPVGQALALAHGKGIAHRDVKPGNIFLLGDPRSESPAVKLLDFGIAKVVSDAQKMAGSFNKTSGVVTSFTPAYGAPEQFSRTHGATGPWTDVFALALILDELLTGREALDGNDFMQLAVSSSHPERRPTPRALGAKVSDAVEAVFAKALTIRPADRYQTAGEFWSELRVAVGMEPLRGPARTSMLEVSAIVSPRGSSPDGVDPRARTEALPSSGNLSAFASVPAATPPARSRSIPSISSTNPSPQASGKSVLAFIGIGAVVIAGGVAAIAMNGRDARPPSAPAPSAAVAVAAPSAAPAGAAPGTCPAGMVKVPGGKFYMGSDDKADLDSERPAHQVTLGPYCVDKFEVDTAAYKACSDKGECLRAGTANEWEGISDVERAAYDPLCNAREAEVRAKHPINCIDWAQAKHYCESNGKRLPTEAEWEFAARGPDGRRYPWGDETPGPGLLNACGAECVAWGAKAKIKVAPMYKEDDGFGGTAPVGSFPKGASRYGVEDVVGNVWEWVSDYYDVYSPDPLTDPKGPEKGTHRVIRGGAWNASFPAWVRPSFRYRDAPTTRSHGIGFRCAKSL